ncbi:hypothetical protein CR194_09400 [Salipaludibacillus keqinensis]|uniref:Phage capsid protein n=1 Tax=Salipaludibacillus keqinensis TaxID=2045207 RepID=A0A323TE88_9BACI|nr:DUF6366 family protein [Salipaludibacillus keqinensis]PYZ93388.1 hypothetical protein CR194_09400 [Salipaludibacillus keqinensis]
MRQPDTREKMRQQELNNNPGGNMRDASQRSQSGSLVDLANSHGWKGLGVLIIVLIVGYVIVSFLING